MKKMTILSALLPGILGLTGLMPVMAQDETADISTWIEEDDSYVDMPSGEDSSSIHKVGRYKYIITGGNTVEIMGWNSPAGTPDHQNVSPISGDFTVPSSVVIKGKVYTVTSMTQQLFYANTAIRSITIPATITSMDSDCFAECTGLQNIYVQNGNTAFSSKDGVLFDHSGTRLLSMPAGRTGTYSVPSGTREIASNAFLTARISQVVLPASVTVLGEEAFLRAENLSSVNLPSGITGIPAYCFAGTGLISMEIPSTIRSIGYGAFSDCPSLNAVSLPSSLSTLSDQAFMGCRSLKSISIPAGIKVIPDSAFRNCTALSSVYLPASVMGIGDSAFQNTQSLEQIHLSKGLTTIGYQAFVNSGLKSVILPETLLKVGGMAFAGCTGLQAVYLPEHTSGVNYQFGVFDWDSALTIYGKSASVPAGLEDYSSRYKGNFDYNNLPEQNKGGWSTENGKDIYLMPDGSKAIGWQTIENQRYYFNAQGYMQTGWLHLNNTWYYLQADGTMLKNGYVGEYYVNAEGIWIPAGWEKIDGKWHWNKGDGTQARNEWLKTGRHWYFFNDAGIMQTGWIKTGGHTYYLVSSGEMAASRWVFRDGHWYYFVSSGEMAQSRWIQLNGSWYYLDGNGQMAVNTRIGTWYVGDDGAWIPGR